jgi:hypothetical protein
MRHIRLVLLLALVAGAGLLAPGSARASAPTVTLDVPANGALVTGGQPTFKGSAGDAPTDTGTVTIEVYAGSSTAAVPVEVLQAAVDSGGYSVVATGLADGTYTAVASESDGAGNVGSSAPMTFSVFNGTPTLTLTAPAAPIQTAVPTFTGTARLDPGDTPSVNLVVYPGTSTNATPLELLSGDLDSAGDFTIQVKPGLADGTYTVVAEQELPTGFAYSPAVQFTVATTTPALAITTPTAGGYEPQTGASVTGTAADAYGDAEVIKLAVYRGKRASGTPVLTATAPRSGTSWRHAFATRLAQGTYTLVASQMNLINVTTVTRTFTVVASGAVSGAVSISLSGRVRVKIGCLAGPGRCEGDVLVLTAHSFRPLYGGPTGPLHLMFAHYMVAEGQSEILTAQLTAPDLAALDRASPTPLKITVASAVGAKLVESSHLTPPVKVG